MHLFISEIIPTASNAMLSNGVIAFAVLLYFADRLLSIFTNLRRSKEAVMPKVELLRELARLEVNIETVRRERKESSASLFDEIKILSTSVSTSLTDVARAIGRLEGGHEIAAAIKSSIETLVRNARNDHGH